MLVGNDRMMIGAAVAASVLAVAAVAAVTMVAIDDAESGRADPYPSPTGDAPGDAIRVLDSQDYKTDIVMPTKVSRPGCEETEACYVPYLHTAEAGQPITWTNNDSAFHSVTSGTYENPTGAFDSGHMDPYDSYTLAFDAPGTYSYYCTLHPWMEGTVIIR